MLRMTRPQVLTFLGRSAAHNEKLARLRWLKKRRRVSGRQARIVRKELNRGREARPRGWWRSAASVKAQSVRFIEMPPDPGLYERIAELHRQAIEEAGINGPLGERR